MSARDRLGLHSFVTSPRSSGEKVAAKPSDEGRRRRSDLSGDARYAERPPHPALRATFSPVKNGGEGIRQALRKRLGVVAPSLLALTLAGCGFTPMYATPGVSPGLASIQVTAPDGRVGYLLREDLDDALGWNRTAPPAYKLEMVIDQTRTPRGLSVTDVAERYVVGLHVKFTLTDLATGKVAHTGEVSSQVSYDAADQPYAGIAARQDSQQRAASDAARQIQLDLAVWMSKTKGG